MFKNLKNYKKKPLSVEVFADQPDQIYKQAKKIQEWSKNLYVKVPIVNTKGLILNKIIKKLNYEKIKLNITAVFTLVQLKKIKSSINKKSPVIISIFCGRIADSGLDPEILIKNQLNYLKTIIMLKFCGQVQEKFITTIKLRDVIVI